MYNALQTFSTSYGLQIHIREKCFIFRFKAVQSLTTGDRTTRNPEPEVGKRNSCLRKDFFWHNSQFFITSRSLPHLEDARIYTVPSINLVSKCAQAIYRTKISNSNRNLIKKGRSRLSEDQMTEFLNKTKRKKCSNIFFRWITCTF